MRLTTKILIGFTILILLSISILSLIISNRMITLNNKMIAYMVSNDIHILDDSQSVNIKELKGSLNHTIRVIIKTDGFEDIFHNEVVLVSDTGMSVEYGDSKLLVGANVELKLDCSSPELESGRAIITSKDSEVCVKSINRGVGNPSYGGTLEIIKCNEGLVIINEINIEEYLKKVVPSEMPASFNQEALKCQAICARSYAYTELGNDFYGEYGADVDDSIQFQVYNNSPVNEATDSAVEDTKGQVLCYEDNIVKTYYYSTSCGSTTDVSLWGSDESNYPYFVAECVGTVDKGLAMKDENAFREFITSVNEKDFDYGLPLYRWNMYEDISEISRAFREYSGIDVGMIKDISVIERANGGAAIKVKVIGDKKEAIIEGESNIRAVFGNENVVMNTMSGEAFYANLPSTFIVFERILEKGKLAGFRIIGGGYGHGIGMSQNAANIMAESMSYAEILGFFYKGTVISLID